MEEITQKIDKHCKHSEIIPCHRVTAAKMHASQIGEINVPIKYDQLHVRPIASSFQ